jgi:ribosomal protein S18 acetylase RimI-like enzyme
MSSLILRDAHPDERAKVETLTRLAYDEFAKVMEPAAWKALEKAMHAVLNDEGGGECIIADDDGRLVGSVFLYPAGAASYGDGEVHASPELRLLAVAPNARKRGVGRALVQECVRRATAAGATELGLHTSKSMAEAIALYESMGFARASERDRRPAGGELVEAYRLRIRD